MATVAGTTKGQGPLNARTDPDKQAERPIKRKISCCYNNNISSKFSNNNSKLNNNKDCWKSKVNNSSNNSSNNNNRDKIRGLRSPVQIRT